MCRIMMYHVCMYVCIICMYHVIVIVINAYVNLNLDLNAQYQKQNIAYIF
jgi:hypothetical protein